jgi:hypothetical protein
MLQDIRKFLGHLNRVLALTLVTGLSFAEEPRYVENPLNNYRNYKSFFGKMIKPKNDQMMLIMESEVAANYKMPNTKRKTVRSYIIQTVSSKKNRNYKRPH